MIHLNKSAKIYICAPSGNVSGGPEALHQLFYYMDRLGYNVSICYYDGGSTPARYNIYKPVVHSMDDIQDKADNVIIVPEIATKLLKKYINLQKCIWWLALQHYDGFETMPVNRIEKLKAALRRCIPTFLLNVRLSFYKKLFPKLYENKPYIIAREDVNLCGSKFAYEYVTDKFQKVFMFVEPLGLIFLKQPEPRCLAVERTDQVLYNPSKPSQLMNSLLKHKAINFVPLRGYDEEQLISLFRKSKLYVDFGVFGGPERLPKETVYNGMLLLVGRQNAAANNFDVAIPDEYKITDWTDESKVLDKINKMLIHYDEIIKQFVPFREKISRLEDNFIHSIQEIFVINE